MNLLVAYDVSTITAIGKKRLRAVAKVCEGFGQRVQYSVFEVTCSRTDFVKLHARLLQTVDPDEDSLRIYSLAPNGFAEAIVVGRSVSMGSDSAWIL